MKFLIVEPSPLPIYAPLGSKYISLCMDLQYDAFSSRFQILDCAREVFKETAKKYELKAMK